MIFHGEYDAHQKIQTKIKKIDTLKNYHPPVRGSMENHILARENEDSFRVQLPMK